MTLLSVTIFAGALFLNAATPGPSVAALVSRVITGGWRGIIPFIAAMWIGEVIWLSMAMAGLTMLAQTFQAIFHIIKWLGCAYLGWLALKMWRQPIVEAGHELPRRPSALAMFGAGMAVTLGNPKIIVFYIALLPSLVDLSSAGVRQWALLSSVTLATLATVDLSWTVLAHKARFILRTPGAIRIANRFGAFALGGAAAAIASRN
ncbi:LysE family translocator [bacterium M00.F.Ca.ET.228.01.1.1]|uniref:LysE family translocator n=1 Tax=Paraburkholderia phenoliruptrix TaxID=252970 RepID=UPI0010921EAA|nr:LysE family translocator [Paraburkholderia phenoliruptrix]TGP42692.1 LysE family translocator [bacterium M00.F.Ca.ET.228.01.1.1]TGR95417.1 LysE family translocator [bacterium M00.F.Ca.ET.191.01.1.1]TGT96306.1 LysE family translocator [bacterium M00.F.Ca.ET.155.01.1.1]MBW0447398.1 LysE family translocator [Paraburkholderia phenoliruptrix]MBW9098922.1 LysE family translocator [Paraburkholderia phenoliruptrix]